MRISKIITTLSLILISANLFAQNYEEILRHSFIELSEIDPSKMNIKDFEPLKDIIGNARVIQLGENNHGDGSTFLAKTSLIKFLHEKMDFDVLVFESGFFETTEAYNQLKAGKEPYKAIKNNIYDIYSESEQLMPIFKYIQKTASTDRPLTLYGMDPQMSSYSSGTRQFEKFQNFIKELYGEKDMSKELFNLKKVLEYIQSIGSLELSDSEYVEFIDFNTSLMNKMNLDENSKKLLTREETTYWNVLINNLKSMAEVYRLRSFLPEITTENINEVVNLPENIEAQNIRDKQMANNVQSIIQELEPNKKIIIWAANSHVITSDEKLETNVNKTSRITMGMQLKKIFGKDLFTIVSLVFSGNWSVANSDSQKGIYKHASEGSLLADLHHKKYNHGILDLKEFKIKNNIEAIEFQNKSVLGNNLTVLELANQADMLLYIDKMHPSKTIFFED